MTWPSRLYHLVRADFVERVRQNRFLLTLGVVLLGGYLLVPPAGASYMVGVHPVELDSLTYHRGIYDSAWVGTMVAAMTGWILSLAGFYLVKGTIERDRQTGVADLIAASPLSRPLYVLGKWLGNVAVLAAVAGAATVAAGAMQLIRGEEMQLQLGGLVAPFVWLTLPPLILVAAISLLFETVPGLRGGFGHVLYALGWLALLPFFDHLTRLDQISQSVLSALRARYPQSAFEASLGINPAVYGEAHTFRWEGICWTPALILERVAWVAGAMLVVALTMLIFAHTRTAPGNGVGGRRGPRRGKPSPIREGAGLPLAQRVRLPALPEGKVRFRFVPVLRAELRLALGCQPWWWHLGALGWAVGGLLAPAEVSRQYLLPAAWLWPVPIWSAMGTRETHYRTDGLVFSTPHPLRRQLPAIWLSGLVVTLAAGSGAALRLILAGDWAALAAWAIGASFVPALALALGVWSGSGKAFEGFYSVLWYVGPVNQLVALDFMGATDKALAAGVPLRFLALTVLLLGLATAGRGRQIRLG